MGDTAAWTGQLLAALVHKFAVDREPSALPHITAILQALDFVTINCTSEVGYVPRVWALPTGHELQWPAFRAYFTPTPPYLNGSGVHGVYHCSRPGSEDWYWQVCTHYRPRA